MDQINSSLVKTRCYFTQCTGEITHFLASFYADHFRVYVAAHVIAKAEGLAIISVIKAGFMITARGGSGIVIARLADRRKAQ